MGEIEVGSVWKDRVVKWRYVRVTSVNGLQVFTETCAPDGSPTGDRINPKPTLRDRWHKAFRPLPKDKEND